MTNDHSGDDATEQTLIIDEAVAAHIRAHATETYPNECCGALSG